MVSILPSLYRKTKTFAFHHQRAPPTPFLNGHTRPPFKSWANQKPNSLWGREYRSVLEPKHGSKKLGVEKWWILVMTCIHQPAVFIYWATRALKCFFAFQVTSLDEKKCVMLNSDNLSVTVRCWNTLLEMFYIIWASCGESCDQFQFRLAGRNRLGDSEVLFIGWSDLLSYNWLVLVLGTYLCGRNGKWADRSVFCRCGAFLCWL